MAEISKEESKWLLWLKRDKLGKRLLIGALILFALTLFVHFREVQVEIPELGSEAKNYIVTPVNFQFLDKQETGVARQESVRDIGKVYRILPKSIENRWFEFENFLIHNQRWRSVLPNSTFEEILSG